MLILPWYRTETQPSPADMLAGLRHEFLKPRISASSPGQDRPDQISLDAWTFDTTAAPGADYCLRASGR